MFPDQQCLMIPETEIISEKLYSGMADFTTLTKPCRIDGSHTGVPSYLQTELSDTPLRRISADGAGGVC